MAKQYALYLCGMDFRLMDPNPECPQFQLHTPMPSGYLERHEWAEEKLKTHRQRRCPGCDLLLIWEER